MKKYILLLFVIIYSINLFANSNYSASLTYKHIQGTTYEFNLVIYKDTLNIYPYQFLKIGNNTDTLIKQSQIVNNGIAIVKYKGTHDFHIDGSYTILVSIGNREGGVNNIPNSNNRALTIQTHIIVNSFIGSNNSAIDSIPLIDTAIVNQAFSINLSSNDIDGDSLSYKLKPCRGSSGYPINGYTYPAQPPIFSLDSISGILTWNTPQYQGNYSVLIQIEEWRSGILISYTEREHFIVVDLGSSIDNPNDKSIGKVDIFPNPFNSTLNIEFTEIVNNADLYIFDMVGRQLFHTVINGKQTNISTMELNKGVYFVKIQTSDGSVFIRKVVKN